VDELIRQLEHADFMERTRLHELRPDVEIRLSVPGGYERILEHINVHRYFMGIQQQRDISWQEAVLGWLDDVYLPLVHVIDEYNILREFPKRTQTDLYLWIIEHLWYLREEFRSDVSLEEAATHFAGEFSKRPVRQLLNILRRTVRFLSDGEEPDEDEK
jgi:hypothetical protein